MANQQNNRVNKIEQTVKKLSGEIWTDIKAASDYKLSFGEESITDKVLLELARLNSNKIKIIVFTKNKERIIGADFFWIIGMKDKWASFLIQAKKITHTTQLYQKLFYIPASKGTKKPNEKNETQLEVLKNFSDSIGGLTPCYCFYNSNFTGINTNNINCPQCIKSSPSPSVDVLGWTITSIKYIKEMKKNVDNSFHLVHDPIYETIPISCLFHKIKNDINSENSNELFWGEQLIYTKTHEEHYSKIQSESERIKDEIERITEKIKTIKKTIKASAKTLGEFELNNLNLELSNLTEFKTKFKTELKALPKRGIIIDVGDDD